MESFGPAVQGGVGPGLLFLEITAVMEHAICGDVRQLTIPKHAFCIRLGLWLADCVANLPNMYMDQNEA
jgi:hypothetical protein